MVSNISRILCQKLETVFVDKYTHATFTVKEICSMIKGTEPSEVEDWLERFEKPDSVPRSEDLSP